MVTALCWLFWAPRYKMGPQWNTWIEWISVTLCSVWEGKRYQSPFKLLCPGLRSSGISKWSMSLMQSQKLKLWQSILPPSDQRFGLGIASCLSWVQDSIKKKKGTSKRSLRLRNVIGSLEYSVSRDDCSSFTAFATALGVSLVLLEWERQFTAGWVEDCHRKMKLYNSWSLIVLKPNPTMLT